ncbi:DVU_1557 family redox protein [Alkalibaculum bacchi]|mgnify:FL=1|jgi:transcription initiation factor IIE alpha subunit|uniref:DVU_1557 family redox protein n=1 Tax=Alkalibaculum bacchi TaxID=645887 RepID=UPI0026ECE305|nr:CLJU_RS11820 family redox protein [Alkalibaculum bacchi]
MKVLENTNVPWICDKCNEKLELETTSIVYLDADFQVELLKCPKCGMVLIEEDLARGKILEVEKSLEDK